MSTLSTLKLRGVPNGSSGARRPSSPRPEPVSVSWLNGRIEVAFRTGESIKTWTGPDAISSVELLGKTLAQCRDQLGWASGDATLILSHATLGSLLVEVPEASSSVLRRIVEREVVRQKTFAGAAVWYETPVILPERGRAHSVHFMDHDLLDRLVSVFGAVGLRLTLITPASEFLRTLASANSATVESAFVASAVIPGGLLVVVNHQGCGVLQRQVPLGSSESNQWSVELKRTLAYARQHLGLVVEDVRLVGAEPDLRAVSGVDLSVGTIVQRVALPTAEWNRWWLEHADLNAVNLVGSSRRDRVQRPRLQRLGRTLAWTSLGISLVLGFSLERMIRSEGVARQRLNDDLVRRRQELELARIAGEQRLQEIEIVRCWNEHDRPPVYLWLPQALESTLPPTLVLTQVVLRPSGGSWMVTLAGIASPGAAPLDDGSVERFRRSVEDGVIPMRAVSDLALGSAAGTVSREEPGHWSQRLMAAPKDLRARPQRFQLEGQIP